MERRTNTPQERFQNNLKNFMDDLETLFKQIAEKMMRMDLDELAEYYEKKIKADLLRAADHGCAGGDCVLRLCEYQGLLAGDQGISGKIGISAGGERGAESAVGNG